MGRTVIGTFDSWETATRVLEELLENGFTRDEVSLLANRNVAPHFELVESAPSDAAGGAAIGGLAGFVAGIAALAIPGIGPVLAAGPLAAGLIGAAVGAAAGGMIGTLRKHGVSEEEAEMYAEAVRRGATLVAVNTSDDKADPAIRIMNRNGAFNIEERAEQWSREGWRPTTSRQRVKVQADPERIRFETADQVGRARATEGGAKVFIW
jgi:hypothetical protein